MCLSVFKVLPWNLIWILTPVVLITAGRASEQAEERHHTKSITSRRWGHSHSNLKFRPTPRCLPSAGIWGLFLKAGAVGSGHQFPPDSLKVRHSQLSCSTEEVAHVIIVVKWRRGGETSRMSHDGTEGDVEGREGRESESVGICVWVCVCVVLYWISIENKPQSRCRETY